MLHILNIESSPRSGKSASIAVADAFLAAYRKRDPKVTIDTLNVWEEDLPEFDAEAIGAKYKGAVNEGMEGAEAEIWQRIKALAQRFHKADRIVLGVPMWNFAYPYKLKQLIDLACQRNLLFSFDGRTFGPLLETRRALVIYTRGQAYDDNSPIPPAQFDHQTGYIDFWLRFIGVKDIQTLVVESTWSDKEAESIRCASEEARSLASIF